MHTAQLLVLRRKTNMDNLPAEAACEIIEVYCLISPQLCRGERAINREKHTNASLFQVVSSGREWGVLGRRGCEND